MHMRRGAFSPFPRRARKEVRARERRDEREESEDDDERDSPTRNR